jgi:predicted nucleotidyltransferase
MTPQMKTILTELRHFIESLYGPKLVRLVLYGSQARGDAEPGSDIDVLVLLRGPVDPDREADRCSDFTAELSLRFNQVVSCIFMDEADFLHRQGPLLRNIRKEGIPV